MNVTAEERIMYSVMKAVYDSGIPISFKGSMVLKACLFEAGFLDETRHTVDIDANWNTDTPPTAEQMVESLQRAINRGGMDYEVRLYRMYGEKRSAGFELVDRNTDEILFTMDVDVNRPITPTQIYEVDGICFRGVSPLQMIADKVAVVSTDKVFRRIKDVVDLYYISKVFEFDVQKIYSTLKCSERTMGDFQGFLQRKEDLRHSYEKFRFAGGVNKPPFDAVYPAEVRASEENGVYRLKKVYYLTAKDDPATIPTADFEREGRTYTLLDLLKNDQTETDTREHIEVVTLESKTKDMAEILKMLEPKLEVKTEDGYEGVLSLDHTTIQVEAAGYGTSSRTVTAERTYPNLSDADVSLVPKSVNENGRTLTLADVSWQEAAVDPTDGYDIPIRYTAVASYTGTATSKYATGYTVTADYKGDVTRASCDTVVYTAVFSSVGNEAATDSSSFNWLWLLIPVGAAALGGCGYAGYKGYHHYINKKRGYAA